METILFILFLVGVQVVDALLKAQKKRKEVESQRESHPRPHFHQQEIEREERSALPNREEEGPFGEDEEELFEPQQPPQPRATPVAPPFSQPDPSPIPDGVRQLQELFRALQKREEQQREKAKEIQTASHTAKSSFASYHNATGEEAPRSTIAETALGTPNQQMGVEKAPPAFEFDASHLRSAILYSEILGKPKALRRGVHRF